MSVKLIAFYTEKCRVVRKCVVGISDDCRNTPPASAVQ